MVYYQAYHTGFDQEDMIIWFWQPKIDRKVKLETVRQNIKHIISPHLEKTTPALWRFSAWVYL